MIKFVVLALVLSMALARPLHLQSIDVKGCGKTKGCSRMPAGCEDPEGDCDYFFTQQADHDSGVVRFEISAKVGGWAAFGYNNNHTMNGTDVVGCQLSPNGHDITVKNMHNVNHSNFLDFAGDANHGLQDVTAAYRNGRIICSFVRTVLPIEGDATSRDLSNQSYIIMAANVNGTANSSVGLMHKHNIEPFILDGMFTAYDHFNINATKEEPDYPMKVPSPADDVSMPMTIDVKGCGKTMGCSRMPAGCNDPVEDCEYFFTQEANRQTGLVRFEICASVAGWAAFGYNSNHTMNGTDVMGCQLAPELKEVTVKNMHNINHSNYLDFQDQATHGLQDISAAYVNGHILCTFVRPIKGIEGDPTSRDLSEKSYIIMAGNVNGTANASVALMHKHNVEPFMLNGAFTAYDVFNFNATKEKPDYPLRIPSDDVAAPMTIDVKGCGKTMGCSRMPAGCNDPVEDCEYFFTQEANRKTGLVRFEICASVAGWAAFGYNSNHTMNGTDVMGCQLSPELKEVTVKNMHNINHSNYLDFQDQATHGLQDISAAYVNGHILCTFVRPIEGIKGDPTSRDLSQKSYIIMAGNVNGTANASVALMHKHNVEPFMLNGTFTAYDVFNFNATKEKPDYPLSLSSDDILAATDDTLNGNGMDMENDHFRRRRPTNVH